MRRENTRENDNWNILWGDGAIFFPPQIQEKMNDKVDFAIWWSSKNAKGGVGIVFYFKEQGKQ